VSREQWSLDRCHLRMTARVLAQAADVIDDLGAHPDLHLELIYLAGWLTRRLARPEGIFL
jgi:hypothetical protein